MKFATLIALVATTNAATCDKATCPVGSCCGSVSGKTDVLTNDTVCSVAPTDE